MGVSGSVYPMEKEIRTDWMEVFLAMLLKKSEVMKLYDIYTNVDDDKNGSISVVKLLKLLNIERTEFTEGMFSSFDNDLKDKCDFYEFVVSVWKFCTLGTAALSVFAFDHYDTNADGVLTKVEALKMFQISLGAKVADQENMRTGLEELSKGSEAGGILMRDFSMFCKTHQAMMAPVFAVQNQLKRMTLGTASWERISRRRVEVHKGFIVPLSELMLLHSDRELFRSLLDDTSMLSVSSVINQVLKNTEHSVRKVERHVSFATVSKKAYAYKTTRVLSNSVNMTRKQRRSVVPRNNCNLSSNLIRTSGVY